MRGRDVLLKHFLTVMNSPSFSRICATLGFALLFGSPRVNTAPLDQVIAVAPAVAENDGNDFHITLNSNAAETSDVRKYLTYGWNGWSGRVVRWRYNDANRSTSIVASASAALSRIQTAMSKWSAVCNVQFVYDGTSANAASLATGTRDGQNVIAWGTLAGNTTGVTYVGASGSSGSGFTLDEADMVLNFQFNPNFDATLVHEVGHMLGIRHSNLEGAVMSGPNVAPDPSTTYTSLSALQADDIAACRSLYGAASGTPASPVASASAPRVALENKLTSN